MQLGNSDDDFFKLIRLAKERRFENYVTDRLDNLSQRTMICEIVNDGSRRCWDWLS
ncbi:hypothetical protein K0U27_00190 [archaeon]|nr:hypothetical protein [archaeon]